MLIRGLSSSPISYVLELAWFGEEVGEIRRDLHILGSASFSFGRRGTRGASGRMVCLTSR
jgi:hypothetical protein